MFKGFLPVHVVSVVVIVWEESSVMSFLNHDKCHRRLVTILQRCTSLHIF